MAVSKGRSVALGLAMMVLGVLPMTTGCGAFFQCEGKTSCGTATGSTSDDVVYAGNQNTSTLSSYYVGSSGTFTVVSTTATTLTDPPTAMAVTPDNDLLYVAETDGQIFSYVASTVGVLSNVTQQSTAGVVVQSMVVSPDEQWLIALDSTTSTSPALRVYKIGTAGALSNSTGGITAILSGQTFTTYQVAISPKGDYVAVALGTAGTLLAPFTTSTGVVGTPVVLGGTSSAVGDASVAFDGSENLYVARNTSSGGEVAVYPAGATASTVPATAATGVSPRSLTFADSYGYLYAANATDSTITTFTVTPSTSTSAVTLTAIGTAVAAPTAVEAMAVDNSGKILLGAGIGGTSGLESFTIGSSGAPTAAHTAELGSNNGPPVIAVTH